MPSIARKQAKPIRKSHSPALQFDIDFRNEPVQNRSRRTLQRIIDATSRLLHRLPPHKITTGLIASEAKIAVGSVYRFFPDKQTIMDAIAAYSISIYRDRLQDLYDRSNTMDGPSFISAMTDAWVDLFDTRKDVQTISFLDPKPKTNLTGTPFLKRFLVDRLKWKDGPDLELKLKIRVEISVSLLALAYSQPTVGERKRVIGELKSILCRFFFPNAPSGS